MKFILLFWVAPLLVVLLLGLAPFCLIGLIIFFIYDLIKGKQKQPIKKPLKKLSLFDEVQTMIQKNA